MFRRQRIVFSVTTTRHGRLLPSNTLIQVLWPRRVQGAMTER